MSLESAYKRQSPAAADVQVQEHLRLEQTAASDREWQALLPKLDRQLHDDIKLFVRSMKAAKITPDWRKNKDAVFQRRSAWTIGGRSANDHDQTDGLGPSWSFRLVITRVGHLCVLPSGRYASPERAFSGARNIPIVTADEICEGMARRLLDAGVDLA